MSYKFTRRVGQYIISHWRGEHTLARAFWINDAVLTAILLVAYVYFMGYVEYTFTDSLLIERVRLSLFVLAYSVLVPWQLYGLTHTAVKRIKSGTKVLLPWIVIPLVLYKVFIIVEYIYDNQDIHKKAIVYSFSSHKESIYNIRTSIRSDNTIFIAGSIGKRTASDLEKVLLQNPSTKTLDLYSDGGNILGAMSLSDIVLKYKLNTHVPKYCQSACVRVFMTGKYRTISKDAYIGFHQPRNIFTSENLSQEELEKDLNAYVNFLTMQGVTKEFAVKVYQASPDDMWIPSHKELLEAGVVHEIKHN